MSVSNVFIHTFDPSEKHGIISKIMGFQKVHFVH